MRKHPNLRAEQCRDHDYAESSMCAGTNAGRFFVKSRTAVMDTLCCVVGDGGGWDHVSVSVIGKARTPYWSEMCQVKDLFFRDDEVVMQLHPAKKDYVNNHPFVLHLWRPQTEEERMALEEEFGFDNQHGPLPAVTYPEIPLPPKIMV